MFIFEKEVSVKTILLLAGSLALCGCLEQEASTKALNEKAPDANIAPLRLTLPLKMTAINCLGAAAGDCAEYSQTTFSATTTSFEERTVTRFFVGGLSAASSAQTNTRITSEATVTQIDDNNVQVNLAGTRAIFKAAVNQAAVTYYNNAAVCGFKNWVVGVERSCSSGAANGVYRQITETQGQIAISSETRSIPIMVGSVPFKLGTLISDLGTQNDAKTLYNTMIGDYASHSASPSEAGSCLVENMDRVILSSDSLERHHESGFIDENNSDARLPSSLCVHVLSRSIYQIGSLSYYSPNTVQAQLGSETNLITPLNEETASYYNYYNVCGRDNWQSGAEQGCPSASLGDTAFLLLSVSATNGLGLSRPNVLPFPLNSDVQLNIAGSVISTL